MTKTVLITGAASGIGLATAQLLHQNNFNVVIIDQDKPIERIQNIDYYQCDISDAKQLTQLIEQITQKHIITHVFSNAGIHLSATLEETSIDQLNQVIDVNLKGTLFLLRAILPHLRQNHFGRIILNASEQALVGKPNSVVYGATKAAIAQIAKSITIDHAPENIIANAICPGTIDTPLYQQAIQKYCQKSGNPIDAVHADEATLQPVNRIGSAGEVAELVMFLFSGKADYIAGSYLVIDGGYTTR